MTVLVIDEQGEKLGVMDTREAIDMAASKGLDLIEVSSSTNPPVAKIMSWSKFKYELEKKKKDSKGKITEQKEMWFKAFIGENDLEHKLKKVKEFIVKKNPVKLTIRAKGRVTSDLMRGLMDKIIEKVSEYAEPEGTAKYQGRNMSVIVKPRKTKLVKVTENHSSTLDMNNESTDTVKLDSNIEKEQ